ncbi:hypothetical protein MBLNU459_g3655t1 [Dothideomycetes sp. NU459]
MADQTPLKHPSSTENQRNDDDDRGRKRGGQSHRYRYRHYRGRSGRANHTVHGEQTLQQKQQEQQQQQQPGPTPPPVKIMQRPSAATHTESPNGNHQPARCTSGIVQMERDEPPNGDVVKYDAAALAVHAPIPVPVQAPALDPTPVLSQTDETARMPAPAPVPAPTSMPVSGSAALFAAASDDATQNRVERGNAHHSSMQRLLLLEGLASHHYRIPPGTTLGEPILVLFKDRIDGTAGFEELVRRMAAELEHLIYVIHDRPEFPAKSVNVWKERQMTGLLMDIVPALAKLIERIGVEVKDTMRTQDGGLRIHVGGDDPRPGFDGVLGGAELASRFLRR